MRLLLLTALLMSGACQTIVHPRDLPMPELARAKVATDIDTYRLQRVGILPPVGDSLNTTGAAGLQELLFEEFSATAPFEVVLLSASDLDEIDLSEPYQRGVYKAETIVGISRRYRLDAMLVGTVLSRQDYPPLRLDMHVDLVAAETGMAIWTAAIGLRGDRPEVRQGLEAFYGNGQPNSDDSWATSLLSPSQFSRFAASQLAQSL